MYIHVADVTKYIETLNAELLVGVAVVFTS